MKERPPVSPSRSPFPLSYYVPLETMFAAQFNYWEVSLSSRYDNGRIVHFHISDIEARDGSNLSIIIASELKYKGKRPRMVWYFGLNKGKPLAERSENEISEYKRLLDQIPRRRNRVAGRKLKGLIETALQDLVY